MSESLRVTNTAHAAWSNRRHSCKIEYIMLLFSFVLLLTKPAGKKIGGARAGRGGRR